MGEGCGELDRRGMKQNHPLGGVREGVVRRQWRGRGFCCCFLPDFSDDMLLALSWDKIRAAGVQSRVPGCAPGVWVRRDCAAGSSAEMER